MNTTAPDGVLHEVVLEDGSVRRLGNKSAQPSSDGKLKYKWSVYGTVPSAPMVPRSQWDSMIENDTDPSHPNLSYVHDQNGIGQCNADATTGATEDAIIEAGLPPVQLSAADLYDRINGGSDDGSTLEDGIVEAMARGMGLMSTTGPHWRRGMKTCSADERAQNKVLFAFLCPTFDHCMSAVLNDFKLISGIPWYDNYSVDQDGWLPLRPRGNSGGHAIRGYKAARRRQSYGIWHKNSWGVWGMLGGMVIPESAYYNNSGLGGWWAIRAVSDAGGSAPNKVSVTRPVRPDQPWQSVVGPLSPEMRAQKREWVKERNKELDALLQSGKPMTVPELLTVEPVKDDSGRKEAASTDTIKPVESSTATIIKAPVVPTGPIVNPNPPTPPAPPVENSFGPAPPPKAP